ncbi:hypothetical protein FSP39_019634 [Pinctada imbricata]|uniref:DNA excision repair protein ERCC-8 n=1 Tax=Pinctada imbricata TaxID=66713 RepID=A0AA88Y023_PINIB|nr:hypothetical protein FSP39_019634 [Pinctada imbricata]
MLNFLSSRESGIDDPNLLRGYESTKRAVSLELSKHRDVERVHYGGVNSLDLDVVESRYLLSGTTDGTVHIHDTVNLTGDVKFTLKALANVSRSNKHKHKHSVETVQWYPLDSGMFLSSGGDKQLKVWDTNSMVPVDEYEFKGIIYSHHMSAIAVKHSLVAAGCHSSSLQLVDLKSGSASHMLKGHQGSIFSVKWSTRDEFLLASGSADNRILLWDIRSSKGPMMHLDQHNGLESDNYFDGCTSHGGYVNGLCFTQNGLHLLSYGTDNRLRLWNTTTGQNTLVNYGRIRNDSKKCVQFSVFNGSRTNFVFVPEASNIKVFDMHNGNRLSILRGHYTQVNCCKLHRDYQELYSGGNDCNILIWTPETDKAYDDHIKAQKREQPASGRSERNSFVRRTGATNDTWSSDEEES